MNRRSVIRYLVGALTLAVVLAAAAPQANAWRGCCGWGGCGWGGCGWYGCGWGGCGCGSYGCGSCGCGGYAWGGYGWGGYGYSGSSCSTCWATITPAYSGSALATTYYPAASTSSTVSPQPAAPTTVARSDPGSTGTINVIVPADAQITVNGQQTKSPGSQRTFVSYGLQPNQNYVYQVQARVTRGGKLQEQTRSAVLQAGKTATLTFDLGNASEQLAAN
jgi:uncharacterized protein (TIGR03000 family)